MPVDELFAAKVDRIREFLLDPDERVLVIRRARDMGPILQRQLARFQDDPATPHALAYAGRAYDRFDRYFPAIADELIRRHEELAADLDELGIALPPGPEWPDPHRSEPVATVAAFAEWWSATSEALPDDAGTMALILEPESVASPAEFRWAVECLAWHTRSAWAKYLVIDDRDAPRVDGVEGRSDAVSLLEHDVAPQEVEAQVHRDLESGLLTPRGVQQYAAMAAAFASARGETESALAHQQRALRAARREGTRGEQANILYDLGNTFLAEGDLAQAEAVYLEGAELAMADEAHVILYMILANLGVALFRAGRHAEAQQSFGVARATCRALGQRPGEAHVLDCAARAEAAAGRPGEAERHWMEALRVYQGITNPNLADLRRSGERSVVDALARLFRETGQDDKLARLPRPTEN